MFKMIANMLDVNHSVLSGAMDIVVVRKKDGSLSSSPFHIRFGTLKILKAREKIVEIYVNNEKTNLVMKLSSSGDAYFASNTNLNQELSAVNKSENNVEPIEIIKKNENEEEINKIIDLNEYVNFSDDSLSSPVKDKKSVPNSPNLQFKHFSDVDLNNEIEDEADENLLIKVPSFTTNNNDMSPKESINLNKNNLNTVENYFTVNNIKSGNLLNSVEISLSYNEILKNPEKAEELFTKLLVKKEDFFKDSWKIINNSNLLLSFQGNLYTYKAAAPLLFSLLIYGEEIPQKVIRELNSCKKGMFGFRQRNSILSDIKVNKIEDNINNVILQDKSNKEEVIIPNNKKCFTPTKEQLKLLNLKEGSNEISFVCKSRLSGTQVLKSNIYLWNYSDKIVISDVDGTITRSDVLGHLMPMIGKDWSHEGVTELFTNIEKNGYKMLYLTARAISQSSTTKNYIETLFQNQKSLPKGPIIMSPDGLVSSFKREVIDKTPQTFKISCLTEIKNLFHENEQPFISGFGNRTTDAVSYRSVGIELSKIFIINESGEVTQLNNSYKKTYSLLNEIVDEIFPKF